MKNLELVSEYLKHTNQYPEDFDKAGITLTMCNNDLVLNGTPDDLIELADLLVSLALSKENRGQHWHVDNLNLLDESSQIKSLVLSRK